jgi:4a-hydroxytetrahydrobiopterin dehydratase
MTDKITSEQFQQRAGVEDWRVVAWAAHTVFRTSSFAAGVQLVEAIGELADGANHHPDVDLRYGTVTVRITSHDVDGLSERDAALAAQISAAARELDIRADPSASSQLTIAVDALAGPAVQPFWRAVLGYDEDAEIEPDEAAVALHDPVSRMPLFWFQQMDGPREQRNRIHVDVHVPHDVAEARVAAALDAGGRLVTDDYAPSWWVLADAEGNEACVCTWQASARA